MKTQKHKVVSNGEVVTDASAAESTYTNMPKQLTARNNRNRARGKTPPRGLGGSAPGRYMVVPVSVGYKSYERSIF